MPRLAIVGIVLLLASATLAVGAAKRLTAVTKGSSVPVAIPPLVVPEITGQAFVFAKGTLEDTGFAWLVIGDVHGYAANTVAVQSPPAGTRVKDTGAPTITLKLERTGYPEKGDPEDVSPYIGTSVQPVGLRAVAPAKPVAPQPVMKGAKKKFTAPQKRPPAFVAPNAPKEPLNEMPLPQRARLLSAWLDSHRTPTTSRVRHFLYQHAWIVTGARFGWWHGAAALRELIAADRAAQKYWGIGRRSELVARRALAEVEARAR